MNVIEIIEIRALHKIREILEDELRRILSELQKESGETRLKVFRRINLDTDFVILIMHEADRVLNSESQLSILLSKGLKEYGMVNYSKWQELTVPMSLLNSGGSKKKDL